MRNITILACPQPKELTSILAHAAQAYSFSYRVVYLSKQDEKYMHGVLGMPPQFTVTDIETVEEKSQHFWRKVDYVFVDYGTVLPEHRELLNDRFKGCNVIYAP